MSSSGQDKPWAPASWRNFPAQQQPEYPDPQAVKDTLTQLGAYPPLIFAGECRTLQSRLAKAAIGEAFIVQVRHEASLDILFQIPEARGRGLIWRFDVVSDTM